MRLYLMRMETSSKPLYFTVVARSEEEAKRKAVNSKYAADYEAMPDSAAVVRLISFLGGRHVDI